ncbi:hypothetical protein [Catenulispora pinisilvae]|uniref:hypothetical protein n=1 Tax=Catenulispora pinisilvae TaxID=2705253 RepID=UPI0018923DB4|nr:hypothetical protein [Catenulispora pinisilvae]
MLTDEIANDPVKDGTGQGHLFLLAQPQASRPDMPLGLVGTTNWNTRMQQLAMRAHPGELNTLPEAIPRLLDTNSYRRARGAARATSNLSEGRIFVPNPMMTGAIELQVFEDCGLRLFFSRLTVNLTGDEVFISDPATVSLTRRFLAVAEEASYVGPWSLAIGGTGLHKLQAAPDHTRFATTARYSDEEYRQATAVTWAELTEAPGAVTRRLLGPLLRSPAIEYRYDEMLTDATPDIGQQL